MSTPTDKCPWCGTAITRVRFEEITTRIREEEKNKQAEREAAIRKQFEARYQTSVDLERAKAMQAEKARWEKEVAGLKANLARMKADQEQSKKTAADAAAREALLKKQLTEQADRQKNKELAEQRTILEREHQRDLAKLRSEFTRERDRTKQKVDALERQLKKQTANDLGDGAEIDLYERLREEFPDDRIRRVAKGETGADIHQEVIHRYQKCALIIFDSKNRQAWQRTFASKLREDQLACKADYAILTTVAFPSGKKELCAEEGVIVVNPARAIYLVQIIRQALVRTHMLGLSMQERAAKMDQLYALITSDRYAQQVAECGSLADDLLDLDVQEQKDHQNVWKKRGRMATKLKKLLTDVDAEISEVLAGAASEEVSH
jgi:hypothetical protein